MADSMRYLPTELSDADGNVVYPHTGAEVVWMRDGGNAEEVLAKMTALFAEITGTSSSVELDDEKILVTAKAVNSLYKNLSALGGFTPVIDESTGEITGYKTTIGGADTVFPFSGVCPPLLQVKTWGAGDGSYHYAELKYDVSNASKLHIGTVTSSALNYLYFAVKNGSTVIWEQNSNSEATDVTIDISAYDEIILFSQTRWGAITYAQDISWE